MNCYSLYGMITIIVSSFIIILASLVGIISKWKAIGEIIEKNMHYLISFSAGVFVIISIDLSMESIEHTENIWNGFLWILSGIIIFSILIKLIPDFHNHDEECVGEHSHHSHGKIDARRMIIGNAMHNIGDGILLATSYSINFTLGIITTASIFVHEIIQGTSKFFILKYAGNNIKKSLIISFLSSSSILIGSIGGYFLLDKFKIIEGPLLGITAGAFFIIVINDLIPHSIKSINSKSHIVKHIVWFLIGASIITIVGVIISHNN